MMASNVYFFLKNEYDYICYFIDDIIFVFDLIINENVF